MPNSVPIYNGAGTGSNGLTLAQVNSPAKTVLIFEVTNSGYYDITIPTGTTDAGGWASDVTPANYGGSPAGWGTGATPSKVEMVGFNTAYLSKNSGSNVQYATGILRNSDGNTAGNFTTTARHNDGANYTMADGHAKFLRPSAVSAGYENPTPGDCGSAASDSGSGGLAATTTCSDSTIATTFNVAQ